MENEKAFYVVTGEGVKRYYSSYDEATIEAERLAKKENDTFYVMMTMCKFEPDERPIKKTTFTVEE